MEKKKGVMWLNFLYSFFGFEIIFRGWTNIGNIVTIIAESFVEDGEPIYSVANIVAIIVALVKLSELAVKLVACITYKTYIGFAWMKRALICGGISGAFSMGMDRGLVDGLPLMILFILFYGFNYLYVNKREFVYKKAEV